MTKVLFTLKRFLGFKIKVDNSSVRRSMYNYLSWNEYPHDLKHITKVETFETENGLEILIETHSPGAIIGRGGVFIDGMTKHLKKDLQRDDIKINLKECELWKMIY